MEDIFRGVRVYPQRTFIFLTKQPENLHLWSPFPENAWVGVSITHSNDFLKSIYELYKVKASFKFISFEPFLWWDGYFNIKTLAETLHNYGIGWVVIGQQTPVKKATMPKIEWVEEIVKACDKANIPVFLKNNLQPLLDESVGWTGWKLRQEFPI